MMANTQKFEDYEPLCREENGTAIVQRTSDGKQSYFDLKMIFTKKFIGKVQALM